MAGLKIKTMKIKIKSVNNFLLNNRLTFNLIKEEIESVNFPCILPLHDTERDDNARPLIIFPNGGLVSQQFFNCEKTIK